jgi:hypothetical protein
LAIATLVPLGGLLATDQDATTPGNNSPSNVVSPSHDNIQAQLLPGEIPIQFRVTTSCFDGKLISGLGTVVKADGYVEQGSVAGVAFNFTNVGRNEKNYPVSITYNTTDGTTAKLAPSKRGATVDSSDSRAAEARRLTKLVIDYARETNMCKGINLGQKEVTKEAVPKGDSIHVVPASSPPPPR